MIGYCLDTYLVGWNEKHQIWRLLFLISYNIYTKYKCGVASLQLPVKYLQLPANLTGGIETLISRIDASWRNNCKTKTKRTPRIYFVKLQMLSNQKSDLANGECFVLYQTLNGPPFFPQCSIHYKKSPRGASPPLLSLWMWMEWFLKSNYPWCIFLLGHLPNSAGI